jgi:hypothetical protein
MTDQVQDQMAEQMEATIIPGLDESVAAEVRRYRVAELLARAYCCASGGCMSERYGFRCHAAAVYGKQALAGARALQKAAGNGP